MATTTLNPSEISELIKNRIEQVKLGSEARNEGTVTSVSDGIVRIYGLADAMQGEMIELPEHPWFVACQFHPEFTSTPRDGHPLFEGFVKAAREQHLVHQLKTV